MVIRIGTGDAALTSMLSRQSASLRAETARLTTEMTTGVRSDMGRAVGGDFSALAAVNHSLARIEGYKANTTEAGLFTEVMQNALGVLSDGANDLAGNILRGVGEANAINLDAITIEAGRIFNTSIAALNTRFSERAIFSGVAAETTPLPDANTILAALEGAVAGALTVTDIQTAVSNWFDDPLGYQALYAGGTPREGADIAPGEVADLSVTALDPTIKETLRGLATVALVGRGLLAGDTVAQSALAKAAGEDLMTNGEARAQLMARVGTVQAQIAGAQTRNTAEASALSITKAGIVASDPYDAAMQLEDLQTRLQALYLVTARVSRLTLADYI